MKLWFATKNSFIKEKPVKYGYIIPHFTGRFLTIPGCVLIKNFLEQAQSLLLVPILVV